MPSSDCTPNRRDRSSRALATRPGTSEKTRSDITSLVRRRRRAIARSSEIATSGRVCSQGWRSPWPRPSSFTSVSAEAVAVRGPGSNRDSSPIISLGPTTASMFSRPSAEVRCSFTLPSTMTYSRSPGSPSWNRDSPRASVVSVMEARSSADCSSSRAVKSGARRRTSSTRSSLSAVQA